MRERKHLPKKFEDTTNNLLKQKHLESRSWVDNKVFDLLDLRQITPRNYLTGRWVQSYDVNRDVVCQLPPEQGHPPYIAVRLKETAYGMNDAPRRRWNILDNALCSYGMVPAGADRCCYVLYSINSRERTWDQGDSSQCENKNNISIKPSSRTETDDPYDRMQDPSASSPATEKTVAGKKIDDDLFGTSGSGKDFQVGSEDWNDVTLTGQRIRWVKDSQSVSCIEVNQ